MTITQQAFAPTQTRRFIREAKTKKFYKLFSINDVHPAMYREDNGGGSEISLEIWELDRESLPSVLINEPPGLCDRHDGA